MPQHIPNPFTPEHPAHALFDTLTVSRTDDSPRVPKEVYQPDLSSQIANLIKAKSVSDNVAALLYLLNDDLDGAHTLSQAHEDNATSNYIHQIVHRREGDYSNARYWVMRTGSHPFYATLADLAATAKRTQWDPNEMIAWASRGEYFANSLNDAETQRLLTWCVANSK